MKMADLSLNPQKVVITSTGLYHLKSQTISLNLYQKYQTVNKISSEFSFKRGMPLTHSSG